MLTGLHRRLASEVRSESSRNPFDPIVERPSPSEPSTNAHLPADDDSTEPIEHTFGTYKHPDFGAASEAYALKRQLTDTLSEYTAHATVPSPRTSCLSDTSRATLTKALGIGTI